MNLIQELQALQHEHGFLREEDLRALSERRRVPLYEIEGVSSFYPHFRRTAPPRVSVSVCRDICCDLSGGEAARAALRAVCAGREDVEYNEVSCLGRCDGAPACAVNEVPLPAAAVAALVDDLGGLPNDEPTSNPRRWDIDAGEPYAVLREQVRLAASDPGAWDTMIARISASGLRGMGGAGFPTGKKWELVRAESSSTKYVVCNADESEPGTFKDRVVLEEMPHRVIEGLVLGALAIGAEQGYVYIRHEYGRECEALRRAIDSAYAAGVLGADACGSGRSFELEIFVSPGGYILGEETALLEALEGKRGEPRNKPPYPGTHGLWGQPTLINNVESLAQIPYVVRTGLADRKFFSVSGDVAQAGVHEVPVGTTLRELVERCGGMRDGAAMQAFLPGGASTGFLGAEHVDIVMDWGPLREAGSALGSGAVVIVAEGRDMMALARSLTAFFRNESCGKCVPCRIGTEKAVEIIDGGDASQLELMGELHQTLLETSICGLGQAALIPIQSVLESEPGSSS